MDIVVRAPNVQRGEENVAARLDQPMDVGQKPIQAGHRLDHADTVAQHQERIKSLAFQIEDVDAASIPDAPLAHDLYSLRGDVDGRHLEASLLEEKRVPAGSAADVQDTATAEIERRSIYAKEVRGPKEDAHRQVIRNPVVSAQHGNRRGIPRQKVEEGQTERLHRLGVHY
jgi:hypothetical protein